MRSNFFWPLLFRWPSYASEYVNTIPLSRFIHAGPDSFAAQLESPSRKTSPGNPETSEAGAKICPPSHSFSAHYAKTRRPFPADPVENKRCGAERQPLDRDAAVLRDTGTDPGRYRPAALRPDQPATRRHRQCCIIQNTSPGHIVPARKAHRS